MATFIDKVKDLISSEEKVVLKSVDEDQRLFLGVVLEPEEYDLHKDIYSEDAIRKACESEQEYLQSNVQHTLQVGSDVMEVTKSFIQEVEATIGEQVVKAGTWLREAKINNDPLWESVKSGEFTGWSIGCSAKCDDVPLDCIKSEGDIEKAKWDHSKFQRLDNFDFSAEGAHIALVDRAANGWEALVVKSAPEDVEPKFKFDIAEVEKELLKKLDVESISKQEEGGVGPMVSMSLSQLLQVAFYMYSEDADIVASSIVKSEDKDKLIEEVASLINKDGLLGSPKHNNGEKPKMSDEQVVKAADVQAMIEKASEVHKAEMKELKADIEKRDAQLQSFEDAEEVRKSAKYGAMAKVYESLGDTEGLGEVLKSLSSVEGFDKVIALLDSAADTISKEALLNEEGAGGEGVVLESMQELTKLAEAKVAANPEMTIQKAKVEVAIERPDLVE